MIDHQLSSGYSLTFEGFANNLNEKIGNRKVFILTDENLNEIWISRLIKEIPALSKAAIMVVEAGESSKSIEICSHLWSELLESNADRNALLINIGGGMVTDLGGFVAGAYKRGIAFIHVPTSLLAMVDAANGGKTGINHHHIKNSIGSFYLPEQVLVYPGFLETLSPKELKSGFAEMLKHGLIRSQTHWSNLVAMEKIASGTIADYILESIRIKEVIVQSDFYEKNERKLLNVGHTVGHAIESYFMETGKPIAHGEAVALGLICESKIACSLSILGVTDFEEIVRGITKFFNLADYAIPSFEKIRPFILNDKKNANDSLMFSLPKAIGDASYNIKVDISVVEQAYIQVFFSV